MFIKWQDDLKVLNVQKDIIKALLADNHRLMTTIIELKRERVKSRSEKESLSKNIRMLSTGTNSLDEILSKEKSGGKNNSHSKGKQKIEFVQAENVKSYANVTTPSGRDLWKSVIAPNLSGYVIFVARLVTYNLTVTSYLIYVTNPPMFLVSCITFIIVPWNHKI